MSLFGEIIVWILLIGFVLFLGFYLFGVLMGVVEFIYLAFLKEKPKFKNKNDED